LATTGQDSFNDVVIPGASAKIAFKTFSNVCFAWARILIKEGTGSHHHARSAVAALKTVMFTEALLHWVQFIT
tara:strand:+ start:854 stop:1072 length:219 start_codon:yes stop_codon:yes gene_type:complete